MPALSAEARASLAASGMALHAPVPSSSSSAQPSSLPPSAHYGTADFSVAASAEDQLQSPIQMQLAHVARERATSSRQSSAGQHTPSSRRKIPSSTPAVNIDLPLNPPAPRAENAGNAEGTPLVIDHALMTSPALENGPKPSRKESHVCCVPAVCDGSIEG